MEISTQQISLPGFADASILERELIHIFMGESLGGHGVVGKIHPYVSEIWIDFIKPVFWSRGETII